MSKEINNSLLGGCKVLDALIGHEFDGISSAEIAKSLDISPQSAIRNLATLAQMGWASQDEQKRWRITPNFAQNIYKINNSITSATRRVRELQDRYSDNH